MAGVQKAIIIGATSGIGRELAKQMSAEGFYVGITGRRTHLLDSLENELVGSECTKARMDLTNPYEAVEVFNGLIEYMQGVDIVVINSGVYHYDPDYPLSDELNIVEVNVAGFTAIANSAYQYFIQHRHGHIVGISSVASVRCGPKASYHASKAYVSSYLEGLLCRPAAIQSQLHVTDVRPGYIDTEMSKGSDVFWLIPLDKAVKQILQAIKKKRRIVYITKRWWLVSALMSYAPLQIYRKFLR